MQLRKFWLAIALVADVSSGSLAKEPLSQAPQLTAVVKAALEEFGVPGAAIGLWTPRGNWTLATGLADVASERPVRRRDHFGIRSITKSYTVTVLLQLIAESHGALSLDDPVAKHLAGVPNGDKLTLRQLANMTSGLFDYTQDMGFREAFGADPKRSWTTDELLAAAFDDRSHPPTNFKPGARYQYSNTNTLVLGKLIEALTGRDFDDVLRDQILRPLDLDATTYLSGTKLPRPAVHGYQAATVDAPPEDIVISFSALGPSGAIAATLHDLAAWGRVLADGSLLPADLQQQRFGTHKTSADPASPIYDAYGLGMGQVAGWWGHTGEGAGFEAAVFHQIDRNETFAVLLNASTAHDVPVKIFCRMLQVMNEKSAARQRQRMRPRRSRPFTAGPEGRYDRIRAPVAVHRGGANKPALPVASARPPPSSRATTRQFREQTISLERMGSSEAVTTTAYANSARAPSHRRCTTSAAGSARARPADCPAQTCIRCRSPLAWPAARIGAVRARCTG